MRTEIPAFISVVAVTAVATLALTTPLAPQQGAEMESDVLTWENHITVSHNGEVVWEGHNELTDQGQNYIRSQIANVSDVDTVGTRSSNLSYIAIGNGSASNTGLNNPIEAASLSAGNNPAEGSITVFGPGEFKIVNQFTAGKDIGVVNTTSLNFGSSTADYVSVANFSTEANLLTDDQLTVTQNITIS